MLRIAKLTDAEYVLRDVAGGLEDYYLGLGEAPGVWFGGVARELGGEGVVEAESAVVTQARLCYSALLRYGVSTVHIATAPLDTNGQPRFENKGVDDHLGDTANLSRRCWLAPYWSPTRRAARRPADDRPLLAEGRQAADTQLRVVAKPTQGSST
jgi:hypothetical protein